MKFHYYIKCSLSLLLLFGLMISCKSQGNDLRVYHYNQPEDLPGVIEYSTELYGKYNDVIVEFGNGEKIFFSKKTSFQPVWQVGNKSWNFRTIIEREGDGTTNRPDVISRYSHVRVIKNTPDTVVIHWRYFPNFQKLEPTDIVEEYYTITSDKKVFRTVQTGTAKIQEWENKSGIISEVVDLTSNGIIVLEDDIAIEKPTISIANKIIDLGVKDESMLLNFSFENMNEDATLNLANNRYYHINGNKTILKSGIVGQSIEMDGYSTSITGRDLLKDNDLDEFTIESWVSLSAYPFEWAPIIQQADWEDAGFYFGINETGNVGIHVMTKDKWKSAVHAEQLELRRWYYLAATFSIHEKLLKLFVNGKLVSSIKLTSDKLIRHNSEVTIGLNRQKMPDIAGRMGRGKYPSLIGLEGLLDEVKVSRKVLTEIEIEESFNLLSQNYNNFPHADLVQPELPKIPECNRFNASYTKLSLYPTWDNLWRVGEYADIVVQFENNPSSLVFWRGTNYAPFFVTENGKWIGDQSNEDYLEDWAIEEAEGCLEHMSDKQNRHAFARVIYQSEARILIHWRYASVDSRYLFSSKNGGWGTWTDEYWIVYPDGIAVRHLPHSICFNDGWIENMFLNAPGTKPIDNVHFDAFTVIDPKEKKVVYSWEKGSASGSTDAMISMVNTKSKYRMFCIYPKESEIDIFSGTDHEYFFHSWNHWPVSQIETDGRGAMAEDRITHSSLMHGAVETNYLLYGISEQPIEKHIPLARFWRNPPSIIKKKGINNSFYLHEERAYLIEASSDNIEFEIESNKETPIVNPVFIIKNWKYGLPNVYLDSEKIKSEFVKLGFEETKDGRDLIIFLQKESNSNKIKILISI